MKWKRREKSYTQLKKMTKILMASSLPERDQSRMPRSTQLSPDNILRLLQLRSDPVSLEDLARSLHVKKGNRGALLSMLAKLKQTGSGRGVVARPVPFSA